MESRVISVQPPECVYWPGMNTSLLNQLFLASQNSELNLEINPLYRFTLAQWQHFSKLKDLNFDLKYKITGL